jgi:RNA polymerase sigma-70 factor, ECF subfamily
MTAAFAHSEFEQAFRLHYGLLCNAANKILNDKDASEDVVQEVFIKMWAKREDLGLVRSIKSYLYKATVNTSLNYLESRKNVFKLQDKKIPDALSVADAGERLQAKELEEKITKAIDRLPPQCKAVFVLSRYEGMKHHEIAKHLDISPKTVNNQLVKALDILRDRLKPYLTQEFVTAATAIGITILLGLLSFTLLLVLVPGIF